MNRWVKKVFPGTARSTKEVKDAEQMLAASEEKLRDTLAEGKEAIELAARLRQLRSENRFAVRMKLGITKGIRHD